MASKTQDINEETAVTRTAVKSESGLDENVAGALSYLFGFVTGLIFYLIEKNNDFVRFHAAQSIVFAGLLMVTYIGLTFVDTVVSVATFGGGTGGFLIGNLVSLLLGLVWFVVALGGFGVWVYLMVKAYQGKTPRIPIVATIADRLL